MAATKAQAALRAAKKVLGKVPPRDGVPWRQLVAETARQVANLRKRGDLTWTVTLNEAAGMLAMDPNRLRKLVSEHPVEPPLFTRPAPKKEPSTPAGSPKRKPNTVSRASMVRLFDWHQGLVDAGLIEPMTGRVDLDARVGGDGVPRVRVHPWETPRAPFEYKDEGNGTFRICGVAEPGDFAGLLRSFGGKQMGLMVLTFPEALQLPWEDAGVRGVWAQAFHEWTVAAEEDVQAVLAELRQARLEAAWSKPVGAAVPDHEPQAKGRTKPRL
ncbi:hypothetical protein [Lysobacter enzymogenes]|uniref:hypothetical protein n=1 Tax=Lysobacter enzymogenes TaxID=69 RepID=UPI001A96FC10|nr:hypothetical protein [Lysobacter enzymogenes]QQP97965.1 hypothetical protein JHW38_08165 [Lysobacter enzymogenes]